MSDFNWNDLKFFMAVARAGNPNAAARLLKVDHNTVRRRVSALEADLTTRLFDRSEEGHSLTDEGEKLLRLAETIESSVIQGQADLVGHDVAISGTVRLGVPDGLGTLFIAPRLVKLHALHPNLNIELFVTSRNFNLSKREADMAIVVDRPTTGRVTIKKLADVSMRLHASRSYLERMPPINSIVDLANHEFVGGIDEFDFGPVLNAVLHDAVSAFAPRISCSSSVAQLKATAAGGGLCLFADFVASTETDLVPVLPTEVMLNREIWLAVHSDLRELARIRAVVSFLTHEFAEARRMFS